MDDVFSVPDSTDWLDTPLSRLANVDSALRCQVCKDFYTTPMMTTCSHTFCSLCIRRCLAVEGKCPTCRGADQEVKLRRNGAVEEIVDAFKRARDEALKFANIPGGGTLQQSAKGGSKRKREDLEPERSQSSVSSEGTGRRTRAQSRREASSQPVVELEEENAAEEKNAVENGVVKCPICGAKMKEGQVWLHVEQCTGEVPRSEIVKGASFPRTTLTAPPTDSKSSQPSLQNRLPQLSYSLFKENALRKKLSELGIRSSGSKPLLERRHMEWVNLWNANCDSRQPRSKRDLLQELDIWERTQGGLAPGSQASASLSNGTGVGNTIVKKDFDGAVWAASHNMEFKELIAKARRKKSMKDNDKAPTSSRDTDANAQSLEDGASHEHVESIDVNGHEEGALQHQFPSKTAQYESRQSLQNDEIQSNDTLKAVSAPDAMHSLHAFNADNDPIVDEESERR